MTDLSLEIGKTYQFTHTRKGTFRAQLIDIVPADAGDEADTQLLCVKIDTRRGRGQDRLARSKADVTVTNIRPSLITQVEPLEDDAWLIETRVVEEASREERERKLYEAELKKQARDIARTVVEEIEKKKPKKRGWFDIFNKSDQPKQ